MPLTSACLLSDHASFVSTTKDGMDLIRRSNAVVLAAENYWQRIRSVEIQLDQSCPPSTSSSESISSSSSDCPFGPDPVQKLIDKLQICEVTPAMWDALENTEAEACALLRELLTLESLSICSPSSSSSPSTSSSSTAPSSSSSSSSEPSPSSSSSSTPSSSSTSSSSAPCCKDALTIFSECEDLQLDPPAFLIGYTIGEACAYGTTIPTSSSSSDSTSSSSSGVPPLDYQLTYNDPADQWEIRQNGSLIATKLGNHPCDPTGSFNVTAGSCSGSQIFVSL